MTAAAAPTTIPLRVHSLRKSYGDVVAVDGLDLEVRAGECFGLLGPNGAGKTTTIEICEGLTAPDAGDVVVLGRRWGRDDRELRELLGISLQETQFSEKLTVEETVRLFRSFYRRGPDPEAVIAMVQLQEKAEGRVGQLSGGQRQRLALACALVGDPAAALPRRAHHRPRSAVAAAALGADRAIQGGRPLHPAHDPLHGRGGAALRPRGDRGPRPRDRRRARRASSSRRCAPSTCWSSRWPMAKLADQGRVGGGSRVSTPRVGRMAATGSRSPSCTRRFRCCWASCGGKALSSRAPHSLGDTRGRLRHPHGKAAA